jgi:hypothetical protein
VTDTELPPGPPVEEGQINYYELTMARLRDWRERARTGRIVLKRGPWKRTRQGRLSYYLSEEIEDAALQDWRVFAHEIRSHSGQHTHQGGIVLYVTRGSGYTICNGKKERWKEGDLLLLPIQPGGVEHQHFSDDPDKPSEWVAFRYIPWQHATGASFDQNQNSPDWTP